MAKLVGFVVVLFLFMLMVGTCESGGNDKTPSSSAISSRQVEIINSQLDALHEEVAACRSPGDWALLALVISVAVPLVLAVVLLFRAEKTALHNDEIIRHVARTGLMPELIDAERLLDGGNQKALPPPSVPLLTKQKRESVEESSKPAEDTSDDPGDNEER